MKRFFSLLLLILLTGTAGYLLHVDLKPALEISALLPAETELVLEWAYSGNSTEETELDAERQTAEQTAQAASPAQPRPSLQLNQLLELAELPEQQRTQFLNVAAFGQRLQQAPFLKDLPPGKIIAALLPADAQAPGTSKQNLSERLLVLLPFADSSVTPQEALEQLFGPTKTISQENYQGNHITHLTMAQAPALSFCLHEGLLLCSTSPETLRRGLNQAINARLHWGRNLQQNSAYQQLHLYGNGAEIFCYAQNPLLANLSRAQPHIVPEALLPQHLALVYRSSAKRNRLTLIARGQQGQWQPLTLPAPVTESTGQRLSPDTLVHLWFNGLSPELFTLLGQWGQSPDREGLDSFFRQYANAVSPGRSSPSFFDVFGSQIEVCIKDQASTVANFFHFNAFLQIEVRDTALLDTILKSLLAGLPVETSVNQETEIISLLAAGGLLRPSYAIFKGRFMVADDLDLLLSNLEQMRSLPPLGSGTALSQAEARKAGNLFLFLRVRDLVQQMLPILPLLELESPTRQKKRTPLISPWVKTKLLPLLLQIETLRFRSFLTAEEMLLELKWTMSPR